MRAFIAMAFVIQYFISNKYFLLSIINSRIKYFSYSNFEKNKPPSVTKNHLINGCIIFSASEMVCLVRHFNLIIGDLVPRNDKVWHFYIILIEIQDVITLTQISSNILQYLKYLISKHHVCLIYLIRLLNPSITFCFIILI